jgi:hypothetical protein
MGLGCGADYSKARVPVPESGRQRVESRRICLVGWVAGAGPSVGEGSPGVSGFVLYLFSAMAS